MRFLITLSIMESKSMVINPVASEKIFLEFHCQTDSF